MEWYNVRAAADLCGVKVRTMRQWIRSGKILAKKHKNSWYWQIPESEILRLNYERYEREHED